MIHAAKRWSLRPIRRTVASPKNHAPSCLLTTTSCGDDDEDVDDGYKGNAQNSSTTNSSSTSAPLPPLESSSFPYAPSKRQQQRRQRGGGSGSGADDPPKIRASTQINPKSSGFPVGKANASIGDTQKQRQHNMPAIEELEAKTLAVLGNDNNNNERSRKQLQLSTLEMQSLFLDWNSALKHFKNDEKRLLSLVELVDQLVRYHVVVAAGGGRGVNLDDQEKQQEKNRNNKEQHSLSSSSSSPSSFSHELLAVYVGISSWARVSSMSSSSSSSLLSSSSLSTSPLDDMPKDRAAAATAVVVPPPRRAQQLFELLTVPTSPMPLDLQQHYMRHKRNIYNALLLAWSRAALHLPNEAPDQCRHVLGQMKQEETEFALFGNNNRNHRYKHNNNYYNRLVNIHSYNRVMSAYASVGNVAQVQQLYEELIQHREQSQSSSHGGGGIGSWCRPNAVTHDCLIKAHQVRGSSSATSCTRELFLNQLAEYHRSAVVVASGEKEKEERGHKLRNVVSLRPLPLTLTRVLAVHHGDPDRARDMLDRALEFEQEHPECRGLVNVAAFCRVMRAYTNQDRVEEAEGMLSNLLERYESSGNDHLRPTRVAFGIVMNGYAQRQDKNLESLTRVESILTSLEERLLKLDMSKSEVDCGAYNILMTSYLRTWPVDAVAKIRSTIARMEQVAKQYRKSDLRPDAISYTILMRALVKQGHSGYQYEVEEVMKMMQKEKRDTGHTLLQSYTVALDAWAKSDDVRSLTKMTEILESIDSPDTTCYNVILNAQAKRGLAEEALRLLDRMKADYDSGRSQHCQPDNITYSSVLHALGVSQVTPKRWEKALTCFDDMLLSYQQGDSSCCPSHVTIATLLYVLRTCDDVRDKHVAVRELLQRLERLGLQQGPVTALALILACGETKGPADSRQESLSFALDVLSGLGTDVNENVFQAVFEACHKLLDSGDEKNQVVLEVFKRCTTSGYASMNVLQTLQRICPPDVYLMLTSQDSGKNPNFKAIPKAWKRNIQS